MKWSIHEKNVSLRKNWAITFKKVILIQIKSGTDVNVILVVPKYKCPKRNFTGN